MKSRASLSFAILLAGVLALAASCSRKAPSERATRDLLKMEAIYRGRDVRAAEASLHTYLDHLTEAQRRGVLGHDYPLGLGMTHGRLFMLYRYTGQHDLMQVQYGLSV